MEENTTAYLLGKLIGTPAFLALITFGALRLIKKRKLTGREWGIVATVSIVTFILVLAQNASSL